MRKNDRCRNDRSRFHCNMWSAVCSPLLQEHIGLSKILYLRRYDLILPCPVTIVVKFGVTLIFIFNLSAILGKNDFVIVVVWSHSLCHFVTLRSLSSLVTVLLGILLQHSSRSPYFRWFISRNDEGVEML